MHQHFSIKNSFMFGWHTMRAHSALVFKVVLTVFALQVAFEVVNKVLVPNPVGILAAIVLMGSLIVTGFGAAIISLKLVRNKPAQYRDLLPSFKVTFRYIVASAVAAIAVLAPLIVAGIAVVVLAVMLDVSFTHGTVANTDVPFWLLCASVSLLIAAALTLSGYMALRYSFVRFAVIDNTTVMASLRESAHLVRGHVLRLLGFFIVLLLLNLLGALLLLVGLLVTVPVTAIAYAHVYQHLKGHIETKS